MEGGWQEGGGVGGCDEEWMGGWVKCSRGQVAGLESWREVKWMADRRWRERARSLKR